MTGGGSRREGGEGSREEVDIRGGDKVGLSGC